ncbi:MFS transporter [Lacisediminihabitans changchengi]|uniref:MFS transporter n=1 Tax=Lacisediminihabitans changchengi TaxID=2787634 RepID=A0A934W584_9MICO|nr:MFS transporter [Lacisediminihabitans changchengi]MBK4349069.1 MFS transporter [Lacisediminihabitans changchengi]
MTSIKQSYAPAENAGLYPRLAILAVGLFVVGTNAFVIAGLLPSIAATLHVHASDVSYSITFYAIVVAVAAPAISIFLARMSRTTLMTAGLVLLSLGTVVAALAPTLEVFTAGRIVAAFGGAALVPVATAAAASLASPERRGRAIAFVGVGFTAAVAFGAPLGTAIAAIGGWRVPLFGLAVLAALVAVAVAFAVRGIPIGAPVSVRRRFAILADPRILLALATTLLVIAGFNVVYIFSSVVTATATGGSPSLLAVLLLIFGVAGIGGNVVIGPLTDRFGSRTVATIFIAVQLVTLPLLPVVAESFVGTAVVFAVWGLASNASLLPVQHRLIAIDPAMAGVAISWFSTAMYVGIALAPIAGAAAMRLGGAESIPDVGAAAIALAVVAFQLGWARRRTVEAVATAS